MPALTMSQIETYIETSLNRFAHPSGEPVSHFYIDLREGRQRISKKLVDETVNLLESRGLQVEQLSDGLSIRVDLSQCFFNSDQADAYNRILTSKMFE